MKEINELKKYMNLMSETEKEMQKIEDQMDEDPENEELGEAWNNLYEENFSYSEKCISIIEKLANTDTKTARKMLNMYGDKIENLLSRVA